MSDNGVDDRLVLGLSAGQPLGSAEILLTEALAAVAGARVELIRLDELRISSGPGRSDPDDAEWLWDRLIEADGLIISTPIMTRTVSARLKLLGDRLLGPNADAAIIERLSALRRAGHEPNVPFRVDERVLRPRVAGFLAVGGSLTPQWKTLALPIMHTMTLSMSIAVVDQAQFGGAGTPRSIVLDDKALARAAQLGRNVASQLGRGLDDAQYLGEPGGCPMCHLDVVVLSGAHVDCATCGAQGELEPDFGIRWVDLSTSVIGIADRRSHAEEIQLTAGQHQLRRAEIEQRAARYDGLIEVARPTSALA